MSPTWWRQFQLSLFLPHQLTNFSTNGAAILAHPSWPWCFYHLWTMLDANSIPLGIQSAPLMATLCQPWDRYISVLGCALMPINSMWRCTITVYDNTHNTMDVVGWSLYGFAASTITAQLYCICASTSSHFSKKSPLPLSPTCTGITK